MNADASYPSLLYTVAFNDETYESSVIIFYHANGDLDHKHIIYEDKVFIDHPRVEDNAAYRSMMETAIARFSSRELIARRIRDYQMKNLEPSVSQMVEEAEAQEETKVPKRGLIGSIDLNILHNYEGSVYCVAEFTGSPNFEEFEESEGARILDSVREQLQAEGFRGFSDARLVPKYTEDTEVCYLETVDNTVRIRMGVIIGTKIVVSKGRRTSTARIEPINQISYYVRPYPLKNTSYSHPEPVSVRLNQENLFLTEDDARASILLDSKL